MIGGRKYVLDISYVIIGERGQCVPKLASGYMLAYILWERARERDGEVDACV